VGAAVGVAVVVAVVAVDIPSGNIASSVCPVLGCPHPLTNHVSTCTVPRADPTAEHNVCVSLLLVECTHVYDTVCKLHACMRPCTRACSAAML
jgi:hypothetical protein